MQGCTLAGSVLCYLPPTLGGRFRGVGGEPGGSKGRKDDRGIGGGREYGSGTGPKQDGVKDGREEVMMPDEVDARKFSPQGSCSLELPDEVDARGPSPKGSCSLKLMRMSGPVAVPPVKSEGPDIPPHPTSPTREEGIERGDGLVGYKDGQGRMEQTTLCDVWDDGDMGITDTDTIMSCASKETVR